MSERKMILKMLSEGKITLEEAEALLEALDSSSNPDEQELSEIDSADDKKWVKSSEEMEENYEELEERFEEMNEELDELEEELDDKLDELNDKFDELEDEFERLAEMDELDNSRAEEIKQRLESKKEKLNQQRRLIDEKREFIKVRRKELKDQFKEMKGKLKTKHRGLSFDLEEGLNEISRGFEEFKTRFKSENLEEIKSMVKDIAGQINEGMKELRHGLNEGSKEIKKAFGGRDLKKVLGDIFKSFRIGSGITFEEEYRGTFDLSEKPATIDLKTFNGRIEVTGTDSDEYVLILNYNIHAENEKEARSLKDEMCTITQRPDLLKFEAHKTGIFGGISARLSLPKKLNGNFILKTSNGRIVVKDLKNTGVLDLTSSNGRLSISDIRVKEISATTSNGRIELNDYAAEKIDLHTSNGAIYIDGICDEISARTSNGSITVYPGVINKANVNLSTSNGKINVVIKDEDLGVDVDASTSMGSISLDIPDMVYQKKIEKSMHKSYLAQSKDYISREKRIQIQAATSMGSISVRRSE